MGIGHDSRSYSQLPSIGMHWRKYDLLVKTSCAMSGLPRVMRNTTHLVVQDQAGWRLHPNQAGRRVDVDLFVVLGRFVAASAVYSGLQVREGGNISAADLQCCKSTRL